MSNYAFVMSEADILKEYREAKFPREQIKILAEQNLVTPKVMRDFIISRLGNAPEFRTVSRRSEWFHWSKDNVEMVRKMATKKMSDTEIGKCLGVSTESVRQLRYAHGIPIGKYEERKRA